MAELSCLVSILGEEVCSQVSSLLLSSSSLEWLLLLSVSSSSLLLIIYSLRHSKLYLFCLFLLVCPSFVSHFLFLLLSEQKFNFDELGMGLKHFGKYFCIWTGWTQHRCALIYLEACLMSKTGPSCPKTFAQPFHSSELLHL